MDIFRPTRAILCHPPKRAILLIPSRQELSMIEREMIVRNAEMGLIIFEFLRAFDKLPRTVQAGKYMRKGISTHQGQHTGG